MVAAVVLLVISIILMAIAYALTPSPKQPTGLNKKLEIPVAEEGKIIGILYGTDEIKDASVVAYWGLQIKTVAVPAGGK